MDSFLHWIFGHWWKNTWVTAYYDGLEQQCRFCGEYRHRSTFYGDSPYLSSWRDGQHPYHPESQM